MKQNIIKYSFYNLCCNLLRNELCCIILFPSLFVGILYKAMKKHQIVYVLIRNTLCRLKILRLLKSNWNPDSFIFHMHLRLLLFPKNSKKSYINSSFVYVNCPDFFVIHRKEGFIYELMWFAVFMLISWINV